jgi:hypothetical protein
VEVETGWGAENGWVGGRYGEKRCRVERKRKRRRKRK